MNAVVEARPLGLEQVSTRWQEVLADASLRDLPCKDAFLTHHGFVDPYAVAPENCVEIKSLSNAESELQTKVRLYLDAGAREVWLVDAKGKVRLFDADGIRVASLFDVDVAEIAFTPAEGTP